MDTIIYNTFMQDKTLFDNFYKTLSDNYKIKMLCSIYNKMTRQEFKNGLKEIKCNMTELFEGSVLEYLYKTCDRKDMGDGTSYYVPNENYKNIFTAFLEVYGCNIDYEYEYGDNEYGYDECDTFNKYYDEVFNNIDMLKIYVDYIIKDKAKWEKNIKSFVSTIYNMIHSLHDNIIKYIFEEFEKKQSIRNIFIKNTYRYDFIEKIFESEGDCKMIIKRLFTHKYKVENFKEFFDNYSYHFTDAVFMKECFKKMSKASSIQLADIFALYCKFWQDDYMENSIYVYLIKASIRLNRNMNVSKKMQKMKKFKGIFLNKYFIQLGVLKSHRSNITL